jgi:hypothetical protein
VGNVCKYHHLELWRSAGEWKKNLSLEIQEICPAVGAKELRSSPCVSFNSTTVHFHSEDSSCLWLGI